LSYFSKKGRLKTLSQQTVEPLNKGSHTDVVFALTDGEMESLDSLSIGRGYRDATGNARPDR
jgi:hypothetical protein